MSTWRRASPTPGSTETGQWPDKGILRAAQHIADAGFVETACGDAGDQLVAGYADLALETQAGGDLPVEAGGYVPSRTEQPAAAGEVEKQLSAGNRFAYRTVGRGHFEQGLHALMDFVRLGRQQGQGRAEAPGHGAPRAPSQTPSARASAEADWITARSDAPAATATGRSRNAGSSIRARAMGKAGMARCRMSRSMIETF